MNITRKIPLQSQQFKNQAFRAKIHGVIDEKFFIFCLGNLLAKIQDYYESFIIAKLNTPLLSFTPIDINKNSYLVSR